MWTLMKKYKQVDIKLWDQLGTQLWGQLKCQLKYQLWSQIRYELWWPIWNQLLGQFEDKLESPTKLEMKAFAENYDEET